MATSRAGSSRCSPSGEPYGGAQVAALGRALDGARPNVLRTIFEILGTIRQQGVTVLLVEQNAAKALQLADRGYILENREDLSSRIRPTSY